MKADSLAAAPNRKRRTTSAAEVLSEGKHSAFLPCTGVRLQMARNRLWWHILPTIMAFATAVPTARAADTFAPVDFPSAKQTFALGIAGDTVVGYYVGLNQPYHGFLYNGSTYTTIDNPNAGTWGTIVCGISQNTIAGYYVGSSGHLSGFIYNGSAYQVIAPSGARDACAYGISGNNVVGAFITTGSSQYHGFLYDGSTYRQLDAPLGANGTWAFGIDGNNIVGYYSDTNQKAHGLFYNGSTYTTLDDPLGSETKAYGIWGNSVIGCYNDKIQDGLWHGFLYDGAIYTTLDCPLGVGSTYPFGICGQNIAGSYAGSYGFSHGFIATIPEPDSMAFFVLCGLGLIIRRKTISNLSSERVAI